jgi:hypothetical protein
MYTHHHTSRRQEKASPFVFIFVLPFFVPFFFGTPAEDERKRRQERWGHDAKDPHLAPASVLRMHRYPKKKVKSRHLAPASILEKKN